MQSLGSELTNNYLEKLKTDNKQLATDNWDNKLSNPIANWNEWWKTNGVDSLLQEFRELISPDFKAWYARSFSQLNEENIRRIAGEAKHGNNPKKLFSYLINKEVKALKSA